MSKKIPLGVTITLVLVAIAASIAITMSVSQKIYNKMMKDLPARTQMYSNIETIDEIVRTNYYGAIAEDTLNSGISQGYLLGINDKYSYFMTAEEYSAYLKRIAGNMSGIGITAALDPDNGYIYVAEVFENSPAKSSGLVAGDKITAIEGEAVTGKNYAHMVENLEGEKLTSISIKYLRGNEEKTVRVVKGYNAETVSYTKIGDVAYVKIRAFYEVTAEQLEKVLEEIKKQNVKGIIFDVRNNENGEVRYAVQTIDLLVPTATEGTKAIATVVDAEEEIIEVFSSDANDMLSAIPVKILINEGTVGCAELFACSLKDFKNSTELIGTKTAGKGTKQEIYQLDDGSAIMLTVGKILPYKSESYEGSGINPDVEVVLTNEQKQRFAMLTISDDPQIQRAISGFTSN